MTGALPQTHLTLIWIISLRNTSSDGALRPCSGYRIKTKSKDIRVRYFLFAYKQLVESIWYLFYHEEVSFKKYLMELSESCTTMVNNVERKARNRKQS